MDLPSPVEIDFKENGGPVTFRTVEEVKTWLETERAFYGFLGSANPLHGDFNRSWQNLADLINDWRPGQDISRHLADLKARLERFAGSGYIHSSRPEAQFAKSLPGAGGGIALAVIARRGNQQGTANADEVGAVVRAVLYQMGVTGTAESQRDALDRLRREAQTELHTVRQERERFEKGSAEAIANATTTFESVGGKAATDLAALAASAREQSEKRDLEWKDRKDALTIEMKGIADTYRTQMALQEPVEYWRKRRAEGLERTKLFAYLGVGWLVLVAVTAFLVAKYLLVDLPATGWSWRYVPVAVVITIVLWIARALARLFWANAHLEADAAQRIVLMQAYLALNTGGQADKDVKKLALESLFRRTSTGLVGGDDAVTPMDLVTKFVSGKS